MSRVGKNPVAVPDGVQVAVDGQHVNVKGKLGELAFTVSDDVEVGMDDGGLWVKPRSQSKRARSLWGTSRARLQNLVTGVTQGFTVELEITGVGYRAAVQGKELNLQLGYSHEVRFPIPEGITIACPAPTQISVTGIDKQQVGQAAAVIRAYRPPEPYKGKGIKYRGEQILRKEGKKK
jgi:large subunit ribosomal protein L6